MPAELMTAMDIPSLADKISPAMRTVLQFLRDRGFIQNSPNLEKKTAGVLKQLAALGLVDPGYTVPVGEEPFVWVSNANGERMVRHLSNMPEQPGPKLKINPRAKMALSSLSEQEQIQVLVAVESLLGRDPSSWPSEEAARLKPDKSMFLLRVSPELRAFVGLEPDGTVELLDIMLEETLRLFSEQYHSGNGVG